jgi:NAD-dependent deacetylase
VSEAAGWIADSSRIVVLTGAGISTESGIPDYRGPDGVWTKNPAAARLSDIDAYVSDPEVRREAWIERLNHPAWTAKPGPAHLALVDLERRGRLIALATQNIDGLHRAAGTSLEVLLELHGTIWRCRCLSCGFETPMQTQLDRVREGDPDPHCVLCGGIQRSATIAFGQSLDHEVMEAAYIAAEVCDLFLAVGSSLVVWPAAGFPLQAKRNGARLAIINREATEFDTIADLVVRADIGTVLAPLIVQ